MTLNEEKALKNMIRGFVMEALEDEALEIERRSKAKKDSTVSKHSKKAGKNKRAIVIKWLKDPQNNCAQIMRDLWHPEESEEDAARSYFYKCRDGKLNDSGEPYKFSDEDINALYSIKTGKDS